MANVSEDFALPFPVGRTGSSLFKISRLKSAPCPKDTPVSNTANGTNRFDPKNIERWHMRYASEARKWILGTMRVGEFLVSFLLLGDDGGPEMPDTHTFGRVLVDALENEREIYDPLLDNINGSDRCLSMKFVEISTLPLDSGLGGFKSDCLACSEDEMDSLTQECGRIPANLSHAEIFIDLKPGEESFVNPLRDKTKLREHNFIVIDDKGELLIAKKTLSQNVVYAAEACARQHRTSYFSVLIVGTQAQFIRWDRAGAIVTPSFDYKAIPQCFCDFLRCFGLATAEQRTRGYNSTVVNASKCEEKCFGEAISDDVAFLLDTDAKTSAEDVANAVKISYQRGKVTKVDKRVLEQSPASRPVTLPIFIAGRSTRGYWTVKLPESGLGIAFLKDMRRIEWLEAGGDQDEVLNGQTEPSPEPILPKAEDENVASADNRSLTPAAQWMRTNEFVYADWALSGRREGLQVVKHTQFRITLKDVGHLLKDNTKTRGLFDGAGDVFGCLIEAHEKCDRLHRDVSLDNITLIRGKKPERQGGIFVDWELSTVTNGEGKAREYRRTGTWAYMSGAALNGFHDFQYSLADDMESVLYVVVYCAVRWLPHNKMTSLGRWLYVFFDASTFFDGRPQGGDRKQAYIGTGNFTNIFDFTNNLVQIWFRMAYKYLWTRIPSLQEYGIELQWVSENVRKLFNDIRTNALPDDDRVYHDIDDFYEEIAPPAYATHTSVAGAIELDADGNTGPSRSASKRTLDEGVNDQSHEIGRTPPEEPQRDSKRKRTDTNEGRYVVSGEGKNSKGRVSRKNSSRKQNMRQNAPTTNKGPSGATGARSSSRHTKSGGRASRKNSLGKQGLRQSARLAAKASSSSIHRGS